MAYFEQLGRWGSNPRPAEDESDASPRSLPHLRRRPWNRVSTPPGRPFRASPIGTLIGSKGNGPRKVVLNSTADLAGGRAERRHQPSPPGIPRGRDDHVGGPPVRGDRDGAAYPQPRSAGRLCFWQSGSAVNRWPGPSRPRARHRRSDRGPATAAEDDAFARPRRYASGEDRPAEAAHPGRPVAGTGMPDRQR